MVDLSRVVKYRKTQGGARSPLLLVNPAKVRSNNNIGNKNNNSHSEDQQQHLVFDLPKQAPVSAENKNNNSHTEEQQ